MTAVTLPVRRPRLRPFFNARIIVGGGIILFIFLCGACAPLLSGYKPADMDLLSPLLPPVWVEGGDMNHPLGTDSLGRDILTRLLYGARVALYVAFVAGTFTMIVGSVLGLAAGYFGRWTDWTVVKLIDLWMCFPPVVLAMILMIGLGIGLNNVILAVILVDWTRFARVIRSEALVTARHDYIAAARLLGVSPLRIIIREMLPSVMPLAITLLSIEMAIAIIVEAVLSFVGLGVEAHIPAWGQMIADARLYMYQNIWAMILPVVAIFLAVFGFNLLGDGLRRALDPRMRGRSDA